MPPSDLRSPDGRWEWDGTSWVPVDVSHFGALGRHRMPVELYGWLAVPVDYCVSAPAVVVGGPGVIAGALLGQLAGRAVAHHLARTKSQPRWHHLGRGEVVVGADGLVLAVSGGPFDVPYRSTLRPLVTGSSLVLERPGLIRLGLSVPDPASLAASIGAVARNRWWEPPRPRVFSPVHAGATWCRQDPRFIFAVPNGWQIGERWWLAGWSNELLHPVTAGAVVQSGDVLHSLVVGLLARDGSDLSPDELIGMRDLLQAIRANGVNGQQIGAAEVVALGGELAVMIHFRYVALDNWFETAEVFCAHGGQFLHVAYVCAPSDSGMFPVGMSSVESALATWRWLA